MEVCGLRCIVSHVIRYKAFKLSMEPCRMVLESMFLVLHVFSIFFITYILFWHVCLQFLGHVFLLLLLGWSFSLPRKHSSNIPSPHPAFQHLLKCHLLHKNFLLFPFAELTGILHILLLWPLLDKELQTQCLHSSLVWVQQSPWTSALFVLILTNYNYLNILFSWPISHWWLIGRG